MAWEISIGNYTKPIDAKVFDDEIGIQPRVCVKLGEILPPSN